MENSNMEVNVFDIIGGYLNKVFLEDGVIKVDINACHDILRIDDGSVSQMTYELKKLLERLDAYQSDVRKHRDHDTFGLKLVNDNPLTV